MAVSRRRKVREVVLQLLFQQDFNPEMGADAVRSMIRERLPDQDSQEFAWSLFVGVMECRALIDRRIEEVAENWTLKRMAPTDRNILRLGAYELMATDTPYRVVIDEAIELARRYGTAQSAQFVNGILDRLIPPEKREPPPEPPSPLPPAPLW